MIVCDDIKITNRKSYVKLIKKNENLNYLTNRR